MLSSEGNGIANVYFKSKLGCLLKIAEFWIMLSFENNRIANEF